MQEKLKGKALRQFRSDIARLKKKGLVSSDVDARSVQPTRALLNKVDKFENVLSGKATPVKLSKKNADIYGALETYEVVGRGKSRRVIVPHGTGQKIIVTHDKPVTVYPKGINRMPLPVERKNINQYLRDAQKDADKLNRMKKKNQVWAFKVWGNQSLATYSDLDLMLEDLENMYQGLTIESLEIVTVSSAGAWERQRERNRAAKRRTQTSNVKRRKAYAKMAGHKKEESREKVAERMRRYRARMKTKTPAKYEAYKTAARKRAAKSKKGKK